MLHLKPVTLFLIVFAVPLQGIWELRKNTFVVDIDPTKKKPGEFVELQCEASADYNVYWTKKPNKSALKGGGKPVIEVREYPDTGNFTCHFMNNDIAGYNVVLINTLSSSAHKKTLLDSKQPIRCEAKNYSGYFNCLWKVLKNKDVEFVFHAQRGPYHIHCELPVRQDSVYSVQCHDTKSCHYAEEDQHIEIVLGVIQEKSYKNHTLSFVLRDIMKPDPPHDLKSTDLSLEWKYPKTWCNVHSFFPLIFNVNITNDSNIKHYSNIEHTNLTVEHKGKWNFCVQARDMYYNSLWSDWTCSM
ncbi:hypothetical protein FKM82_011787 [Ascaphus truei]